MSYLSKIHLYIRTLFIFLKKSTSEFKRNYKKKKIIAKNEIVNILNRNANVSDSIILEMTNNNIIIIAQ